MDRQREASTCNGITLIDQRVWFTNKGPTTKPATRDARTSLGMGVCGPPITCNPRLMTGVELRKRVIPS